MEKKSSLDLQKLTEMLSPLERKVIPFLHYSVEEIEKKSSIDKVSVLRALKFLENKGVVKLKTQDQTIIDLGTNGIYYKKNHLPERQLLTLLESKGSLALEEAKKLSKLSENEFKVALGILKNKAILSITQGKLSLDASKEELMKKTLEEQLIELLPVEQTKLAPEHIHALEQLRKRKDIVETLTTTQTTFELTALGKEIAGKELVSDLLEEVTPEVIRTWSKNKKFRKYDIHAHVPKISGGRRHFSLQAREDGKKIWIDMGFKEMSGSLIDTSFWVFDALFTPQDHPAREMQDTFFIKGYEGKFPDKEIVKKVQQSHESGIAGSKGWEYTWKETPAKKLLLRTHTTSVSARTLASLKEKDLPVKYFIISKVFRNETLDWNHGFEFYQAEGIVVDKNANFRHLLGYLQQFYKKMGFEKIRFRPSFFAYTEPSVEVEVFHPQKKIWVELGGAGVFRPEVVVPLLGKNIPVLAWGQGFDRIIMDAYKIKDLREMYSNDMKLLREKQVAHG